MSEIPSADYNTEFMQGGVKAAITATQAKSGDLWMVPIDNLAVPEGLNVRIHNTAYEERIEEICDSIMVNGFFRHMPLSGYAAKDGDKTLIYVTGGFTRMEAAKRAVKRGSMLQALPVVLHPPGTSMVDIQVSLLMDNTNNPLSPYEKGIVVKRLSRLGFSEKDIAEKLILSQQYINRLLYLHGLPSATQQMVVEDQVSANHAVLRSLEIGPDEALAEFQEESLQRRGKDRIEGDPATEAEGVESRGTAGRARPRAAPRAAGVSKKVIFGAIDYAIAIDSIELLARWRKNDAEAVAEVAATLKKPKKEPKPKAVKVVKVKKAPRKTKAEKAFDRATATSIGAEADRQEHDGL